jgi:hypothetical protein
MATLGDKVMLFGGQDLGGSTLHLRNDTWQWDGNAWMQVLPSCTTGCASDSPPPQSGHTMASRDGSILLVGVDTWEWKGGQWLWRPASPKVGLGESQAAGVGLIASRHVAMAALGDRAVLWGDTAGTWEWDGAVWTPLDPSTSPPRRFGHAMAALGDKVILFGGIGLPSMDLSTVDTWQWDGTTWARLDPPTSPPWRTGHAMATLGNKVVLFGGGDASFAPLADTWEWDGTTWTKRTPPTSPPARYEHAMATVGNEVVLFGGMGETGVLDDTWTWDGETWTRVAPASKPAARRAHAMTTLDDRIVLFGGFEFAPSESGTSAHDTWAFKSGKWSQILPTEYPAERGDHAMASVAGEIVLVGGSDDLDIWLLDVPPPPCAAPASAMITSFDAGSSLVDSPYTDADVGLTSPTISTASGALVITLDTGKPTTTYPWAVIGLPFKACAGAGAYSGVKFKASGALSAGCSIQFSAIDEEHALPANGGTCTAPSCYGSSAPFDLPATPTDVTILFGSQRGGAADPGVGPLDPAHLLNLQWTVIPSTGAMPGCNGTVTIDDVMFL